MFLNPVHTLPFGGVGGSGFGACHGKFSFDTFSHRKSVLSTSTAGYIEGVNKSVYSATLIQFIYKLLLCLVITFSSIRYPPYSTNKTSDIHSIQSSDVGKLSRFLHLAQMVTKSVTGRAPYHSQEPNVQREEDNEQERDQH